MTDLRIENHGSIIIFQPMSAECREWLEANTDGQWYAGGLVCEPRYASDLTEGLLEAGFNSD